MVFYLRADCPGVSHFVSIIINMTDSLEKFLDRGLTLKEIVVSYFYAVPENVFW